MLRKASLSIKVMLVAFLRGKMFAIKKACLDFSA